MTDTEYIERTDHKELLEIWQDDWNIFVRDVLKANLDKEQKAIISAVQKNQMVAVTSGTARGKDFVAACAGLCFLYLTPHFDSNGKMTANTKVAMTAPTMRQVRDIMTPEVNRLFRQAGFLPGRLVANDIRTDYDEWFLTGFKSDDNNMEVWSGFHAVNTMFIVTEASGISETIFSAIEGNLQGNSRLLIVFNPNTETGYAASAVKSSRFHSFRLDSLNAENVVKKEYVIPGQVDYDWVADKVETWCTPIDRLIEPGDFEWEGGFFRPNDLFRVKVRGMFPKVSEDVLIPYDWMEAAAARWKKDNIPAGSRKIGVDVAGMGRDVSVVCHRIENYIEKFETHNSRGKADHMHVAGMIISYLRNQRTSAFIDTIGEGAGVYSRFQEQGIGNAYSCKFSENARGLKDVTGVREFYNMKSYLYWAARDFFNPENGYKPSIPFDKEFMEEASAVRWKIQSDGRIYVESKDDTKKRLGRSPDKLDAFVNTFYPREHRQRDLTGYF